MKLSVWVSLSSTRATTAAGIETARWLQPELRELPFMDAEPSRKPLTRLCSHEVWVRSCSQPQRDHSSLQLRHGSSSRVKAPDTDSRTKPGIAWPSEGMTRTWAHTPKQAPSFGLQKSTRPWSCVDSKAHARGPSAGSEQLVAI